MYCAIRRREMMFVAHVARRFERLLETYRRSDGGRWGG